MKADKDIILKVLNSDVSTNELSRETGIAVMTLSDLRNRDDDSKIDKMQLITAAKITKYEENERMENNLEYLYDFGDYDLYVGEPGVTDYVDAEIRYHQNVRNSKIKEILITKDDLHRIKVAIEEIEANDTHEESPYFDVNDILGM